MNNSSEPKSALKVAAVARRTGVSVRTLHYYEEIGLLKPSGRTPAGHRLYTAADIQRLQQICSLRQLGLSLSSIGDCLTGEQTDPRQVIGDHLKKVEQERSTLERLENRLRKLSHELERDGIGDEQTTETLLNALELIIMYEKHFTPSQQERLKAHAEAGEEAVSPVIEQLEAARQRGLPPGDEEAQRLWQRFQEAVESVAEGDADMAAAIFKLLHEDKKARADHGISEELFAYLGSIAGGSEH